MIGIVETRDDKFMQAVRAQLGLDSEYFSIEQEPVSNKTAYRLILDRLSHLDKGLNAYLRLLQVHGVRVVNDPLIWSRSNKLIEVCTYEDLGITHPKTFLMPNEHIEWDLGDSVREIDWERLESQVSFPVILKPMDTFGWEKVFEVADIELLRHLYDALSQQQVLILQEKVEWVDYFRVFYVGGKVRAFRWMPGSHLRGRFVMTEPGRHAAFIERKTAAFCRKVGADFNVVEWAVDRGDKPVAIEGYNFNPDMDPNLMPKEYYDWVVDAYVGMVNRVYKALK